MFTASVYRFAEHPLSHFSNSSQQFDNISSASHQQNQEPPFAFVDGPDRLIGVPLYYVFEGGGGPQATSLHDSRPIFGITLNEVDAERATATNGYLMGDGVALSTHAGASAIPSLPSVSTAAALTLPIYQESIVIDANNASTAATMSTDVFYAYDVAADYVTSSSTEAPAYNDDDYLNTLSDDEYIDFVANFLRPTFIELIFVAIFFCLMVVGIVGNCLVVYVVSRNKSMRTSMHIFLTNLALSDLLVLIFCLPPTVINDITKTFWFSAGFCKAILFFQNASVYVSVFTLMCISVERWKAISNPLAIPYWRTHYIIVVVWLISCILSIPEPLTLRIYPADYARKNLSTTWGTRCKESWSTEFQQKYQLTQTVVLFITPLLIISGFCVHMSLVLRKKALQISSRQLRDRQRATKMLIMVVLVFAISYLPVHLHNIATAFNIEPQSEPTLTTIALRKFIPRFMSYSSSCLNPILYNFMSEKFRKEFRRACCLDAGLAPAKDRYFYYSTGGYMSTSNIINNSTNNTTIASTARLPHTGRGAAATFGCSTASRCGSRAASLLSSANDDASMNGRKFSTNSGGSVDSRKCSTNNNSNNNGTANCLF